MIRINLPDKKKERTIDEIEELSYKQARLEYLIASNNGDKTILEKDLNNIRQQIILALYTAKQHKMDSEEYVSRSGLTTKEFINSLITIYKKYDRNNILS